MWTRCPSRGRWGVTNRRRSGEKGVTRAGHVIYSARRTLGGCSLAQSERATGEAGMDIFVKYQRGKGNVPWDESQGSAHIAAADGRSLCKNGRPDGKVGG